MHILLADGQPKVRFALRVLLERQPGWQVVGEAVDAKELLAQTDAAYPDLVLLDWELPGSAVVDLLPALRRACPDLTVIALSGRPEVRRTALTAGADAFVSKTDPPERLLAAILSFEKQGGNDVPENPDRAEWKTDRRGRTDARAGTGRADQGDGHPAEGHHRGR